MAEEMKILRDQGLSYKGIAAKAITIANWVSIYRLNITAFSLELE
jgi:hypothetical protein